MGPWKENYELKRKQRVVEVAVKYMWHEGRKGITRSYVVTASRGRGNWGRQQIWTKYTDAHIETS